MGECESGGYDNKSKAQHCPLPPSVFLFCSHFSLFSHTRGHIYLCKNSDNTSHRYSLTKPTLLFSLSLLPVRRHPSRCGSIVQGPGTVQDIHGPEPQRGNYIFHSLKQRKQGIKKAGRQSKKANHPTNRQQCITDGKIAFSQYRFSNEM